MSDRKTALPQKTQEKLVNELSRSEDGQRVRALLGDEEKLVNAIEKGDSEALKRALDTVLRSEEGKRLFQQLGTLMGKP